ncbi:MAG: hypothetical protein ACLF0G_00575 [Candidatus Brocadiia bacterium]
MRSSSAKLLPLALACLCLPACGPSPRVRSHWPFLYVHREGERSHVEALGPLVYVHRRPEGTSYGVRPLFRVERDAEAGSSLWHVLYPLSYWRFQPGSTLQYAFPLYYRYARPAPGEGRASATVLFPLLWWGHHPSEGRWLFVFPLGGTAKGLLGQDEIAFAGPFYVRMRRGGYASRHVLWPFFSWGRGAGRRSVRLWPFYGWGEEEGRWRNGFVLWPFLTYGRRRGEEGGAADYFFLWPLFGRARARDGESGSVQVLWPFCFYAWNRRSGYREWDMPFPFVRGKRAGEVRTLNVWPLFGQRVYPAGRDTFFLWPLLHLSKVRTEDAQRDRLELFPLFTRVHSKDAERESERSFWLLWPLWRWRGERRGEERRAAANSLQFAWFKWPRGFDRAFNPLLGLVEHEAEEGRSSTALLWRCVRWERGPGWRWVQLGPLVSWGRRGRLTRLSFLLGSVQTWARDGARGWRVLFLPLGAPAAEAPGPEGEDDAGGR